jgi:uncharacterized protein involved in response to NO
VVAFPEPRERGAARPRSGAFALWRFGFRPFYLLASTFASLSIALWAAQFAGLLSSPYLRGPIWHAHEMVFGFTLAVMAGFLFTAVRNWTSRATPEGPWLAALAALWLAGRVLVLTPYAATAAVVNVAFPLAVALGIGIALVGSKNWHNLLFVGLLVGIAAAEAVTHLSMFGLVHVSEWLGIQIALDIILVVITMLGGRVIPMFTANGVPGARPARNRFIERLAPAAMLALLVCDLTPTPSLVVAIVASIGGCAQLARAVLWKPWQTYRVSLVWILHVGYLWIGLHLVLRALRPFDLFPASIATHALTVGAIGALTLGMMTRTAKGHTGRALIADSYETGAFVLVSAAAVVRVLCPLAFPERYLDAIVASSVLWSSAFAIYAVRYWPVLTRARIDGKPG